MPEETKSAPVDSEQLAKEIIARYDRLKTDRDSFYAPAWRSAASWLQPRKSALWGQDEKTPGEAGWVDNLFDLTAVVANEKLAAWLMTNTSPANARWFSFTSSVRQRARLGDDPDAARWWQQVSAITLEQLALSNFYTEKHEAVLDRNTFGTSSVGVFKGRRAALNFRTIEANTYVIAADDEGYIDTVIREFKLTCRQAVQQFGLESLGEKVRKAWTDGDGKRRDEEFCFLHAVYPNFGRDARYDDAANKRWKSCYVSKDDLKVVQEAGFDEMPYAVSRFLKWTGELWGWAPAFTALPTVRETNFFKQQLGALAEKAAFPPVLEPSNLAGMVDSRAGGRTVFDENLPPHALPQEWQTQGRFDIAEFLLEKNHEFINECFYGHVVAMFTNLEREITAFEAAQLLAEKLDIFSPYYFRLINELDTPLLQRCFSILLAEGYYPEPPQSLLEPLGNGDNFIDAPEVTYLSRLALAMQAHEIRSFDELTARAERLAAIDPAIAGQFISNYDLDAAARGLGRNLGVPVSWQKDPKILAQEREAQAEQQESMMAAETAPKMAKAAKDIGETDPQTRHRLAAALESN